MEMTQLVWIQTPGRNEPSGESREMRQTKMRENHSRLQDSPETHILGTGLVLLGDNVSYSLMVAPDPKL